MRRSANRSSNSSPRENGGTNAMTTGANRRGKCEIGSSRMVIRLAAVSVAVFLSSTWFFLDDVKGSVQSRSFPTRNLGESVSIPSEDIKNSNLQENGENGMDLEEALSKPPQVALMFLTRGPLPNEPAWRSFLEAASRLTLRPTHPARSTVNLTEAIKSPLKPALPSLPPDQYIGTQIQKKGGYRLGGSKQESKDASQKKNEDESDIGGDSCAVQERAGINDAVNRLFEERTLTNSIIANQSLFTVYTHPPPDFHYRASSLFYKTEVPDRKNTTAGFAQFVLAEATLTMLKEALKNARNEKFVLLSESCAPIHSPDVVYAQLISEKLSRLNACVGKTRRDTFRWHPEMKTEYLDVHHWRKSHQWFVLTRPHAMLAVADQHVKELFKRHCYTDGKKWCVPDEHFIPTLLASYGLDQETDCTGHGTRAVWGKGWHPMTFNEWMINKQFLKKLQGGSDQGCAVDQARASVIHLFNGINENGCINRDNSTLKPPQESDNWVMANGYKPLSYDCSLFARKFSPEAVNATVKALLACQGGGLGDWC